VLIAAAALVAAGASANAARRHGPADRPTTWVLSGRADLIWTSPCFAWWLGK